MSVYKLDCIWSYELSSEMNTNEEITVSLERKKFEEECEAAIDDFMKEPTVFGETHIIQLIQMSDDEHKLFRLLIHLEPSEVWDKMPVDVQTAFNEKAAHFWRSV